MNMMLSSAAVAAVSQPLAIDPPGPSPETVDSAIFELQRELAPIESHHTEALERLFVARRTYRRWLKHNPKPTAYAIAPPGTREAVLRGEIRDQHLSIDKETGRLTTSSWRIADEWKARADDARTRWEMRSEAVKEQTGVLAAKAAAELASDQFDAHLMALRDTRARSSAGLQVKANLAEQFDHAGLAWSVVEDLQVTKVA